MKKVWTKKTYNLGFLQYVACIAIILLALSMMTSCHDSFEKTAYRALSTAATTYDATMSVAGDLYKQGKIDNATKEKIVKYAKLYQQSFKVANNAVIAYTQNKNKSSLQDAQKALTDLSTSLTKLVVLVNQYRKE